MLDRFSRWKYLRLISGVYLAMFLVRVAFGIVIITFGHYVTGNDFVFGLVVASAPAFELVTVIFAGFLVDRYGRKGVLLAGLGLAAFSLYGLALVGPEHYLALGFMNAVHGVAAGMILVTTLALIASLAPPDKRGREMGLFNFANMFGWIFGFALGSIFLDVFAFDLRYTFVLAGFLATLGLVYGQMNIREPERHVDVERPDMRALAAVFSNRRVLVLSTAWLMVFVFIGSLIAFFSRVALPVEDVAQDATSGTGGSRVALIILAVGTLFMGSQIVFGKLSDKYGRESMMLLGAAGFVLLMVTYLVGVDPEAGARAAFVNALLVLFALFTLAFAPAGLAALADEATESTEGTTMSAYSIVLNLGMITGPPLVGGVSTAAGSQGVVYFFLGLSIALLGLVGLRVYQVRRTPRVRVAPA